MAMLNLDDAMDVLTKNGYLDPRYENEDGMHELIRNELEQKCYCGQLDNDQVKMFRNIIAELTVRRICDHLVDGDAEEWLAMIRDNLEISMEAILRHGSAK